MKSGRLLFGSSAGDDAGVYLVSDELALVQTVDFFTPIVDDPYDFGAIAAANSLSDCFALGATPVTGLNVLCFPRAHLSAVGPILRGGADKMLEAGGVIVGGHSVDDPEPKYGIAVTGFVNPKEMVLNTGARPGDLLVCTKKIGTGIVTNARKNRGRLESFARTLRGVAEEVSDSAYEEAVRSMKTLNLSAARAMREIRVNACTDITGFGFLGHARNVAEASGVAFEIWYESVPRFDGVEDIAEGCTKGGGERNRTWVRGRVQLGADVGPNEFALLTDAQTSGPLLISVEESRAEALVSRMKELDVPAPTIVGRVIDGPVGTIRVERRPRAEI